MTRIKQNSTSVNIIRDNEKSLDYISTPNAVSIFKRLLNSYTKENQRAFSIIGSYGTGKSSFLWALEKNLRHERNYFIDTKETFDNVDRFELIKIIGENNSLQTTLANHFEIPNANTNEILKELKRRIHSENSKRIGLALVVDEFGKFVEYIVKNNSVQDFYFLQQIAEIANDNAIDFLFVITLHQDLSIYLNNTEVDLKNEWKKVSGRYLNLLFNEPIEQLIFFAREKLRKYQTQDTNENNIHELNNLIKETKLVPNHPEDISAVGIEVFPMDWLSINVLVSALQKHGQNERSLFTFLESTDDDSIASNQDTSYTIADVYDYLMKRMSPSVLSNENSNKGQWQAILKCLDRAEVIFDKDIRLYQDIIKTIGLVNIFGKTGGLLDDTFLKRYFLITKGIDIAKHIEKLVKNKFIRFFKHRNKLNFIDGTDLDLDLELNLVTKEIPAQIQIGDAIEKFIDIPMVVAKRESFEKGTTRLFQYQVYKNDNITLNQFVDGTIQLVFDENISSDELIGISKANGQVHLFVKFNNLKEIRQEIIEIKKYELIIQKFSDDRVAINILNDEKNFHEINLKALVLNNQFSDTDKRKKSNQWFNCGDLISITSSRILNSYLSDKCSSAYFNTPIFKNELINREHLTTPINTARKILFRALLSDNLRLDNLGFNSLKFPPEKTIFLSLLKNTGIHREIGGNYSLTEPSDPSFSALWNHCIALLQSAQNNKIPISRFYEELSNPDLGFKLKRGFLEIWIPVFLISQKDNFAMYHENTGYIPYLTPELIDLIHKSSHSYLIKSYGEGNIPANLLLRYKEITKSTQTGDNLNSSFISIFSNFLRFYKSLNEYGKNTKSISPQGISVRDAIKNATDPETALFEDLPRALAFQGKNFVTNSENLDAFTNEILTAIEAIRDAYPQLLSRIEIVLFESFSINNKIEFKAKKQLLNELIVGQINESYLGQTSLVFYKRIISQLDDRDSYLKSVADVALNMSIDKLKDEQEPLLHKTIQDLSQGLLDSIVIQKNSSASNAKRTELLKITTSNISGEMFHKTILKSPDNNEAQILKFESIVNQISRDEYNDLLAFLVNNIDKNDNS